MVSIVQENWGWCEGEVCRVLQDAKGGGSIMRGNFVSNVREKLVNTFKVMWVGVVREFSA